MKHIEKVTILGAGTMGARIAAHLANAGVSSPATSVASVISVVRFCWVLRPLADRIEHKDWALTRELLSS